MKGNLVNIIMGLFFWVSSLFIAMVAGVYVRGLVWAFAYGWNLIK